MLSVSESVGDLALLTWAGGDGMRPVREQVEEAYRELDAAVHEAGAVVLQERVFGDLAALPVVSCARARATGSRPEAWAVPPTFVEGTPAGRAAVAGIHVLAVRSESSRLVLDGERVLGRVVDAPGARLLGLGDVGRLAATNGHPRGPAEDAAAAIDAAEQLLVREGFSFRDVARTWYYLRDILAWYGPFNSARNAAFRRMGLTGPGGDGAIPASTGIEGRNPRGGWCALDLVAAKARDGQPFEMKRLHNRTQNEAPEYGSAFARGMALTLGTHRYLFISGTASIDDHGATVHVGDFEAQARQTIEAIGALLEGAGASLGDVRQATAFLKDRRDIQSFERIAERTGLDRVPPVVTVADVCREELLVEIDATAVVPVPDGEARR
jgi:enamine deaminase RidA (YjgF/YER057c/UK114 family)